MPIQLTIEQVNALAGNSSALSAARGLTSPTRWQNLGCEGQVLWGECKGSAKEPYRVQIDLSAPSYRCSCPSRQFPCKHCLGLLLTVAGNPDQLAEQAPPPWVAEWLEARTRSAERRQERAAKQDEPANAAKRAATSAKSAAAREAKVAAGVAELQRWLADQLRVGLAALQARAPGDFDTLAARMVDAQAPGLARLLREAGSLANSGEGWQERLLAALARLHLLANAYPRLASLAPAAQADVRNAMGFTLRQEELLAEAGVHDSWAVLGRQLEEEDKLRVQRTWLWGINSARPALLLDFAAPGQQLQPGPTPGTTIEAELVFYPSATPLRALLREQQRLQGGVPQLRPLPLLEAQASYTAALTQNPWLERWPLLLGPVRLARNEQHWSVVDEAGNGLLLHPRFAAAWRYLAASGGEPCSLFGVWDGTTLMPLAMQQGTELLLT
jgi:hypothetical protein